METYFTFKNLHRAYTDCRRGKTKTFYHMKFAYDLEANLFRLERQLQNRTYRPGQSIAFIVQKPKIREIFAADFRDRVIHHLLYNYLSPYFERLFIYDSWACREGKGTHGAMLRLQKFEAQLSKEYRQDNNNMYHTGLDKQTDQSTLSAVGQGDRCATKTNVHPGYYLKMDIKSFFTNIDKQILYGLVSKKVKNKEILWLVETIIFHDCVHDIPPKIQSRQSLFDKLPRDKSLFTVSHGKGLPIGNLTSQFFANIYLNELDQFVKHELKAKYYLRYVDDFVILEKERAQLEFYKSAITEFVDKKLKLTVHPDKLFLRPIADGIDFVGYVIRPGYVLVRRRVVGQWRRKMDLTDEKLREQAFASYMSHACWANSYGLREKMSGKINMNGYNKPESSIDTGLLIKRRHKLK